MAERQDPPSPAELLRAAMEKIVFFEWRVSELGSELTAAQTRCAAAEAERSRAEEEVRAAERRAKAARMQVAELEADRARLTALLSRPTRPAADTQALEAERQRSALLEAELDDARRALAAAQGERERWLTEMTEQARSGDEAPAALAQFISELRGEILTLRDRQKKCDALLAQAGIAAPALEHAAPPPAPRREPEPVEQARQLWAEGRIGAEPALTTHFATPPTRESAAARALADQCLRNLASGDSARRENAARHLASSPIPAAAPVLASALGAELDHKARAQMARALAACGGEGAADLVARLQSSAEAPLVRLAAVEALCMIPSRARAAIETAAQDATAAVRRRAAALAAAEGFDELLARFSADSDASVRAACVAARREAPPPDRAPARTALRVLAEGGTR
ncbi:MAG: hypothetical protein LC689_19595 [Myxococcales bacterium]|nr:hypothetical protein [Myxococcales bacterium]